MFSNQTFCWVGVTVLMLLNPRPRRPDEAGSEVKELETWVAISRPCLDAVMPPIETDSLTTVPLHAEPSPYWMDHDSPLRSVEVLDEAGLYNFCPATWALGTEVEKTHL